MTSSSEPVKGLTSEATISLYQVLGVPAPDRVDRGETIETKTKETVDGDAEALSAPMSLEGW